MSDSQHNSGQASADAAVLRKRPEEKARKCENILRDIVETTLAGFWDWNLVDNTEYLSPTFKRMFGYDDHEMESSPEAWQKIIFPEDLPRVFEVFDRHVESRGREPYYNEARFRHRDGSTIWIICTGRIIEWAEDGTAIRMVGCHVDITDRKKAEAALDRQAMVDKAAAEVSLKLLDTGSFEEISRLILEKAKQLTGSPFGFVGYIDPLTGNFVSSTFTREIWDGCRVADKTVVFEKSLGLWGWVLNNRQPLISKHPESDHRSSGVPQGHIPIRRFLGVPALHGEALVGMIALANSEGDYGDQDMAVIERLSTIYALSIQKTCAEEELNRIKNELTDSKNNLEAILSAVPLGILVFNQDARIVSDNPAARAIWSIEEIRPGSLQFGDYTGCGRRLNHPDGCGSTADCSDCGINNAISQVLAGEVDRTEGREMQILQDMEERQNLWIQFSVSPVVLHGRRCATLVIQDITRRKQSEEALRESERYLRSTLDSLSAHIVVLNDRGDITLSNKAYHDFAVLNGIEPGDVSEGVNYLAVCDNTSGEYSEEAAPFAEGIREVLSGNRQFFELEYPCHSPDEKRWYVGRVTAFTGEGSGRVIVAHMNITGRKRAETYREM